MRRWFFRTVRGGRVRIAGRLYRPTEIHKKYDGRLDGLRMLFYLYPSATVGLWGSEDAARGNTGEEIKAASRPEEVDGFLPWQFWHCGTANETHPAHDTAPEATEKDKENISKGKRL